MLLKPVIVTRGVGTCCITAQKMKFSIKDFYRKCNQMRSFLRIWLHILKKSLMENFIFCAVYFYMDVIMWIKEKVTLIHFRPVLNFILKPIIWFELPVKYMIYIWDATLGWNGSTSRCRPITIKCRAVFIWRNPSVIQMLRP